MNYTIDEQSDSVQAFQAELQRIAESFIGQLAGSFSSSLIKTSVEQSVHQLYDSGGALADHLGRIDNVSDVQIIVDCSSYKVNISAIRRGTRTTLSERQANFSGGEITHEHFVEATGREPIQDDLERANCDRVGQPGHFMCGWDHGRNKPRWECL